MMAEENADVNVTWSGSRY